MGSRLAFTMILGLVAIAAGVYAGTGNVASETQPATQAATAPHPVDLLATYPKERLPKDIYDWKQVHTSVRSEWIKANLYGKGVSFVGQVAEITHEQATRTTPARFVVTVISTSRMVWGTPMLCQSSVTTQDADLALRLDVGSAVSVAGTIERMNVQSPYVSDTSDGPKKFPGKAWLTVAGGELRLAAPTAADIARCMAEKRPIAGMKVRDAIASIGSPEKNTNNKDGHVVTWVVPECPLWLRVHPGHYSSQKHRITVTAAAGIITDVSVKEFSDQEIREERERSEKSKFGR